MKNPFVTADKTHGNYVTAVCSLNKMKIADIPVKGIDDTVKGKTVKEIFSAKIMAEKAREHLETLRIPADTSPRQAASLLIKSADSENRQIRLCAEQIAKFFGKRLALILLTLKTALDKNKVQRPDWTDEHWKYWQNIENIIFVGGVTEGNFGETLIAQAQHDCQNSYHLIMGRNAVYSGISGCATRLQHDSGIFVMADFGQTNMKRCIVRRQNGKITDTEHLSSMPSLYMEGDIPDITEKKHQAELLHRYITDTLSETYRKAQTMGTVDSQIMVALANYTHGGILDKNRGGYAKLNLLCDNYGDYLSRTLSDRWQNPVDVTLIHDGTAVALNFSDIPRSVCLTLGTFIGVGFTDIFV